MSKIFNRQRLMLFIAVLLLSNVSYSKSIADLEKDLKTVNTYESELVLLKSYESEFASWNNEDIGRYYVIKGMRHEGGNEIDLAKKEYTRAIKTFEKLDFISEHLVNALIERSYVTYIKSNNPDEYCQDRAKALELARQLSSNKQALARALIQYSFCFEGKKDQFSQALKLLEEALEIAKEHNLENNSTAMIYNATAVLYRSNNVLDKSYEYFNKAYQEWEQVNDIQDMFNMQHSMVYLSLVSGNYGVADLHVKTLFKLSEENPSFKDFLFFSYLNAGLRDFEQNKLEQANSSYIKMLSLKDTTNETYFIKDGIAKLSMINFRLNNFDLAREYAQEFLLNNTNKTSLSVNTRYMHIIIDYTDGNYFKAISGLWNFIDTIKKDKQKFITKSAKSQALLFDKKINQYENTILEQELAINNLKLVTANSKTKIALLTSWIVAIISIVFLLTSLYLWKSQKKFKKISQTDYLTRISNRRFVFVNGQKLIDSSLNKGIGFTVFIFDIDDFKQVNDSYGHSIGDAVLKNLADICQKYLPADSIFGRIGGEEFLYMVAGFSESEAKKLADTIRVAISENVVETEDKTISITISTGICTSSIIQNLDEIIKKADNALYEAKESGKNKVTISHD